MAQHDYILENQPGAAFRADLNETLQAVVSQNSGATEPSPSYSFQWWADTTAGVLKQRNAGNNSWIDVLDLATGRPVGAVAQTGPTGAVVMPEGTDAQRPAEGGLRASTQNPADYFLELENKATNEWESLATREWVRANSIVVSPSVDLTGVTGADVVNVPGWAKRITVTLYQVAYPSSALPILRIGASTPETSGYASNTMGIFNGTTISARAPTTGFGLVVGGGSSDALSGSLTLNRGGGNTWALNGSLYKTDGNSLLCVGSTVLSSALEMIRFTTENGAQLFTGGSISVSWE